MWDAVAYWLSHFSALAELGIAGYGSIIPNITIDGGEFGGWNGNFILPILSPENTTESLAAAVLPIVGKIEDTWPGLFLSRNKSTSFPTFYDWWINGQGPQAAGQEQMGGSRLLDAEALTANLTALKVAMQGMTTNAVETYLISGKGYVSLIYIWISFDCHCLTSTGTIQGAATDISPPAYGMRSPGEEAIR